MKYKYFQKNNKGPAPYLPSMRDGSGFVILFAVTISSILLAIALGISNIAIKEIKFSTSAKDTNDAFFAADTGIEYVLFNDKDPDFYPTGLTSIIIPNLGSTSKSCAKVSITKTAAPVVTTIISKGYNTAGNVPDVCTPGINSVERELRVSY